VEPHITVSSEEHVDNLEEDAVALVLLSDQELGLGNLAEGEEHPPASDGFKLTLDGSWQVGQEAHLSDVTTHVDEVLVQAKFEKRSHDGDRHKEVVVEPVNSRALLQVGCILLLTRGHEGDLGLGFGVFIVKGLGVNKLVENSNGPHPDMTGLAAFLLQNDVPPWQKVAESHDHSGESNGPETCCSAVRTEGHQKVGHGDGNDGAKVWEPMHVEAKEEAGQGSVPLPGVGIFEGSHTNGKDEANVHGEEDICLSGGKACEL